MLEKSGWGQGFRGMGQRAQESWEPPPPAPPIVPLLPGPVLAVQVIVAPGSRLLGLHL